MTAPTTVNEPTSTNTTAATRRSEPSAPASTIEVAAAAVSTKFFGLTPDSNAPRTNALPAVASSSEAIQLGTATTSPGRGRVHHLRTPRTISPAPTMTRPQSAIADEVLSGSSAPANATTTIAATNASPTIQPAANNGPLRRP